jgi:Uma2 family endonuclease
MMKTQIPQDRPASGADRTLARDAADESLRRRLLAMLDAPSAPLRMTFAGFLEWADEDTLAEWVDGDVIMASPASNQHQDLARFLTAVLSGFVEAHALGVVRPAPLLMKLEKAAREPDLLFVATSHLGRMQKNYLDGPADLVVEIVSPESAGRDRGDKFYEYAQGGVPEYWLIDPQAQWVEFYQLEGARYRLVFSGQTGDYQSLVLPDFWLRVEWLWQQPLPLVDEVLLAIGGEAYARQLIERLRRHGFLA